MSDTVSSENPSTPNDRIEVHGTFDGLQSHGSILAAYFTLDDGNSHVLYGDQRMMAHAFRGRPLGVGATIHDPDNWSGGDYVRFDGDE